MVASFIFAFVFTLIVAIFTDTDAPKAMKIFMVVMALVVWTLTGVGAILL